MLAQGSGKTTNIRNIAMEIGRFLYLRWFRIQRSYCFLLKTFQNRTNLLFWEFSLDFNVKTVYILTSAFFLLFSNSRIFHSVILTLLSNGLIFLWIGIFSSSDHLCIYISL